MLPDNSAADCIAGIGSADATVATVRKTMFVLSFAHGSATTSKRFDLNLPCQAFVLCSFYFFFTSSNNRHCKDTNCREPSLANRLLTQTTTKTRMNAYQCATMLKIKIQLIVYAMMERFATVIALLALLDPSHLHRVSTRISCFPLNPTMTIRRGLESPRKSISI